LKNVEPAVDDSLSVFSERASRWRCCNLEESFGEEELVSNVNVQHGPDQVSSSEGSWNVASE